MVPQRIRRVRKIILIGAFCLSLLGAYPAILAEQPSDRDWQRIEKQVDRLTESAGSDAVILEKRLSGIESNQRIISEQISIVSKLGMGIMAAVIGLIVQAFWGLIVSNSKIKGEK